MSSTRRSSLRSLSERSAATARLSSLPSRARAATPFGRQATGWEIAYAALFFVSDESVYVTAQLMAVDAGITGM